MPKLISDAKHWLGWTISATAITFFLILILHFFEIHLHTPIWIIGVVFGIVFIIEVITDIIKHYTNLQ